MGKCFYPTVLISRLLGEPLSGLPIPLKLLRAPIAPWRKIDLPIALLSPIARLLIQGIRIWPISRIKIYLGKADCPTRNNMFVKCKDTGRWQEGHSYFEHKLNTL